MSDNKKRAVMDPEDIKGRVNIVLHSQAFGRENAKSGGELVQLVGLPPEKNNPSIVKAVQSMVIEDGYVICSGGYGTYIPESANDPEITLTRIRQRSRANKSLVRANAADANHARWLTKGVRPGTVAL